MRLVPVAEYGAINRRFRRAVRWTETALLVAVLLLTRSSAATLVAVIVVSALDYGWVCLASRRWSGAN